MILRNIFKTQPINVESLLLELMKIDSTSDNELRACDYVFNLLKKRGFKPYKVPVNKNGYAIVAKVGNPQVYLSSHLDTVPPYFPPRQDETHIHGRGAADAKGSAASMIAAADAAKRNKLTDFGLIFTVGEETDFWGAREVLRSGIKIPFVVVGEPTNLRLSYQHYGLFEAKLIAKGVEAYGAVDEGRKNAIDKLIDALLTIERAVDERTGFPEGSLFNIGLIRGGEARAVLPKNAEANIDITVPPNHKVNLLKVVKKLVGHLVKVESVINIPWASSKASKKMPKLKKGGVLNFASDLSYFKKGVVLGPGSIFVSHSKREKIEKKQLHKAVEIYEQVIRNFQK